MSFVIIVLVKFTFESIVRFAPGPSPVELLKSENSSQDFRWETDMPPEE
jgi:hypothetical protein